MLNAFRLPSPFIFRLRGSFSPLALFAGGEHGAWYDPSDLSTMFQDTAGVSPVTAVGQRVMLMLDKSKGMATGSELIAPVNLQSGWTTSGATVTFNSATSYTSAGVANVTRSIFTIGKWYKLQFRSTFTGQIYLYNAPNATNQIYTEGLLVSGVFYTLYFKAVSTQLNIRPAGALTINLDIISATEVAGNHATAEVGSSRPTLRTDGNGKNYLEFRKASSQRLLFTNPVLAATEHTVAYAGFGLTNTDAIIGLGLSGTAYSARSFNGAISINTVGSFENYSDINTSLAVVSHVFSGTLVTSNRAYRNGLELGVLSSSAGATLNTDAAASLGYNTQNAYGDCNLYETVIINRAITDVERASLEPYLASESGIPAFYDAFLMLGQSNMAGRAPFDGLGGHAARTVQWTQSDTKTDATIPIDHPGITAGNMGLDVSFSEEWAATGGSPILFIPYAPGSTGFNNNNWNPGDTEYTAAVSQAVSALAGVPGARLRAILWLQGEQDSLSIHPTTQSSHAAALDAMIAAMRAAIPGATDKPFVLGQIPVISGTFFDKQALVRAAIADTPNRVVNTAFANNTGLTKLGDGLHYDASSLRTMGVRLCTALRAML